MAPARVELNRCCLSEHLCNQYGQPVISKILTSPRGKATPSVVGLTQRRCRLCNVLSGVQSPLMPPANSSLSGPSPVLTNRAAKGKSESTLKDVIITDCLQIFYLPYICCCSITRIELQNDVSGDREPKLTIVRRGESSTECQESSPYQICLHDAE